ncbi:MAG: bacillithiol biosynthesis cysteine-adding enzyme BshC [Bacteroidota bacterium]
MTASIPVKELITYGDTHSFTPIALDLHNAEERLLPFAGKFFSETTLVEQIDFKAQSPTNRDVLHASLVKQYEGIKLNAKVKANIELIRDQQTFTVTTGHQLGLFTGPLYFIYKIIHTINLAERATQLYPGKAVVPVFWMATEDHDFAEVAAASINGAKVQWDKDAKGMPVGRLSLDDIQTVFSTLESVLGDGPKAAEILTFLKKCYQPGYNLAKATRLLVNELFGKYGIVIIDGDDAALKALFAPVVRAELENQIAFKSVSEVTNQLSKQYKAQVNPRECNLFLFEEGVRRRIDRTDHGFMLADTAIRFTLPELLKRLEERPEDFSPNVILRPVYQEVLLPNLAYIGGGGELAYWLQLRELFSTLNIPFPLLVLRNSVQLIETDEKVLMDKIGLNTKDIFLPVQQLYKSLLTNVESEDFYSLTKQLEYQAAAFEALAASVGEKDPTLVAHVQANEKFLQGLEKKLYRVARNKHSSTLAQIDRLKESVFPGGGLQERKDNIFTFIFRHGFEVMDELVQQLDPENREFTVLYL